MKRLFLLLYTLGGIVMFTSCSNDMDIKDDIPVTIGLSSHEVVFSEAEDSISLTAERSWYIENIYNESTEEYVYKMGQDENSQNIRNGALRGTEIKVIGLIIRKYNDHHVDIFDNGIQPNDTFNVFCRIAPFNHYSESIKITKRKRTVEGL